MPLNVRRFYTSVLLVLLSFVIFAGAQTVPPQTAAGPASVPHGPPTSGDVMRDRISKSKAYIAVRNYHSAIFELENLRRETTDPSVQGVVNVLLMNSYLEQGDYKRAQDMLNEFYAYQKSTKPNAEASYMAVAGQVVKGARSRADRYKALGLSVSDRTLPLEALNDLEKMRETLELVITQSKEMGTETAKAANAMGMLEEASGSRSMLARDDYDSRRWRDELADTRERMVKSGSVVSAVGEPAVTPTTVAAMPDDRLVAQNSPAQTPSVTTQPPIYVRSAPPTPKESPKTETVEPAPNLVAEDVAVKTETTAVAVSGPIDVGSLLAYATSRAQPVYPPAAKTIRTTGVVKVEVTVNEEGEVTGIQKASGPAMLQSAAKDAVRKWKFKPFLRDGQPVKATGFVNFNFSL
ncbi:hypothetical protein BH20ACI2_BH20ACI2_25880 [soil metagenome]